MLWCHFTRKSTGMCVNHMHSKDQTAKLNARISLQDLDCTPWFEENDFLSLRCQFRRTTGTKVVQHIKSSAKSLHWPFIESFLSPSAPSSMPRQEFPAHSQPITASLLSAPVWKSLQIPDKWTHAPPRTAFAAVMRKFLNNSISQLDAWCCQ